MKEQKWGSMGKDCWEVGEWVANPHFPWQEVNGLCPKLKIQK